MIATTLRIKEQVPADAYKAFTRMPHVLRRLRESRNLSQRELAKAAGVSRSQLQRIEEKPWDELSLKEISSFARALGMPLEELIRYGSGESQQASFLRYSLWRPRLTRNLAEGIQYFGFTPEVPGAMLGCLVLSPKKSWSVKKTCRPEQSFWYVLQGNLVLVSRGEDQVFKENESLFIDGVVSFEIFNSHSCQDLLILTNKSFSAV